MKGRPARRSILHVDLDPFFVSVERAGHEELRGRPLLVVSKESDTGLVVAASEEARGAGVRPGQSLGRARSLCPDTAVRVGDLDRYARISDEITALLLGASRRVERPSSDEAYVDLTPDGTSSRGAVAAAEAIKDGLHRRLGLDAALGLASTRLAARVASRGARPRGLLIVLPGYEQSFLARQPLTVLDELPPHVGRALEKQGWSTLGDIVAADERALCAAVGPAVAERLTAALTGNEPPIALAAAPATIQVDATLHSRQPNAAALASILDDLAVRAARRLRPFGLRAGSISVEVRRGDANLKRSRELSPSVGDELTVSEVVEALAEPLLDPASTVRSLHVRLTRLSPPSAQSPLFPSGRTDIAG